MKFLQFIGKFAVLTGIGLLGFYAVIQYYFPTYTHRYRLTVEIEADGKVHSGSGVTEVSYNMHGPLEGFLHGEYDVDVRGRAAFVDLGDRGIVVALLSPGGGKEIEPRPLYASDIAIRAFYTKEQRKKFRGKEGRRTLFRTLQDHPGKKILSPETYPPFAWFPDPANRQSAQRLNPAFLSDEIGPSVHLKQVSIEMTNDAFPNEIFNALPWLYAQREREREREREIKRVPVVKSQLFDLTTYNFLGGH